MPQLNFDASRIQPNTGFDTIPAGWYKAVIDESELRPTKDGTGTRLNLRFLIIEGPYAQRKVFCGLNIQNASEKAVEIALGQLSAIAHAVGVLQVADSAQLHNLPMWIKVKVRKDESGQYEDQNDINTFKNINDPTALAAAAPPALGAGGPPQQPWQQPPPAAAPPGPPPAAAAPPPWTPPGAAPGAPAWQHQPPAQSAATTPAAPPAPPHPAQTAPPPWQQPPAAGQLPAAGSAPPWQQPRQ